MMPSLGPFLVVMLMLSWVVLPLVVVIALAFGPRLLTPEPLWVRRCRRADPAEPESRPCWVPVGERCPKHEPIRPDPVPDYEPVIA